MGKEFKSIFQRKLKNGMITVGAKLFYGGTEHDYKNSKN